MLCRGVAGGVCERAAGVRRGSVPARVADACAAAAATDRHPRPQREAHVDAPPHEGRRTRAAHHRDL